MYMYVLYVCYIICIMQYHNDILHTPATDKRQFNDLIIGGSDERELAKHLDLVGFDSSIVLVQRVEIPRSIGSFTEV